jgi:radical SAM protein with 4Fe4S-binding SPASM domain
MHLPEDLSLLQVVVTHSCKRNCGYCYNKLLNQETLPDAEQLMNSLTHVLDASVNPLTIEVIGGEPLESGIIQVTENVLRTAHEHPNCRGTILCTAVCEPKKVQALLNYTDYVYLSIDTSLRESNVKKLNQDKIREVAKLVTESGSGMSVSTILFGDETKAHLQDFIDCLVKVGVDSVGFAYPYATSLSDFEINRFSEQFHWLYQLKLLNEGVIRLHGELLENIDLYVSGRSRPCHCSCGKNAVVIEPNGELTMGICFDHMKEVPTDWQELRKQIYMRQEYLLKSEPCKSCTLWTVCYGGCLARGNQDSTGISRGRDEVSCSVLQKVAYFVDEDRQVLSSKAISFSDSVM